LRLREISEYPSYIGPTYLDIFLRLQNLGHSVSVSHLAHPTLAHPTLAHPTLAHPTLAHPTLAHPTTVVNLDRSISP
jgi:hypothetical protein